MPDRASDMVVSAADPRERPSPKGRQVTRQPPASPADQTYALLGADGLPYTSRPPGRFGGHRRQKIYGGLDCRAAQRAISAGGYVKHRVFFADEASATATGYRPCAVCLPAGYRRSKAR